MRPSGIPRGKRSRTDRRAGSTRGGRPCRTFGSCGPPPLHHHRPPPPPPFRCPPLRRRRRRRRPRRRRRRRPRLLGLGPRPPAGVDTVARFDFSSRFHSS